LKNKPSILISGHEPIARLLLSTAPHLANLQSRYTNWKYSTNKLYVTEKTVEYSTDCTLQYKLNSTVQTVHYSANCTLQYRLFRTVTIVQYTTSCTVQYGLYRTIQTVHGSNFHVHGEFFFFITFFLPHRFRNSPVKKHCQWFPKFNYRVTHKQWARHFRTTVWNFKVFFFFHGSLKLYTVHQVGEGRRQ